MELHRQLDYNGAKIHYREEGRGNSQTLVLLHGFLQSLDVWSPFMLSYMHSMHVVAIDLPGHGFSDNLGNVNSMEDMADAVNAVLDELEVDHCVMVGHSMGGYVALAYADRYLYRLKGLALLHAHALPDTQEHRERRQQVCHQVEVNRAGYILNFVPSLFYDSLRSDIAQEVKDLQDLCLNTQNAGIIAAQIGMARRPSRIDLLSKIQVPVLSVFGKQDNRLDVDLAVSQAMIPSKAEIVVLNECGHMSHIEEYKYIKSRICGFVETCFN